MKNIINAAAFLFILCNAPPALAAHKVTVFENGKTVSLTVPATGLSDTLLDMQSDLSNDTLTLPKHNYGQWNRPQLHASMSFDALAPAAHDAVRALPIKVKYSNLPEPHIASMLLLGVVVMMLSIKDEKDEKFTAQ